MPHSDLRNRATAPTVREQKTETPRAWQPRWERVSFHSSMANENGSMRSENSKCRETGSYVSKGHWDDADMQLRRILAQRENNRHAEMQETPNGRTDQST